MKGWTKCPSVTPGGKEFFYHRDGFRPRTSVVWSRAWMAWVIVQENRSPVEVDGKSQWTTATYAMKAAEQLTNKKGK